MKVRSGYADRRLRWNEHLLRFRDRQRGHPFEKYPGSEAVATELHAPFLVAQFDWRMAMVFGAQLVLLHVIDIFRSARLGPPVVTVDPAASNI
jgi:hypothetical protein